MICCSPDSPVKDENFDMNTSEKISEADKIWQNYKEKKNEVFTNAHVAVQVNELK